MRTNARLAAAVGAVLDERGMTLRAAAQLTGLHYVTIRNLRQGVAPQAETILKFAWGLGLDSSEWLELAGHAALVAGVGREPAAPTPEQTAEDNATRLDGYGRLVLGLAELYTELGRPIPVSLDLERARKMTVAQAEETLDTLRRQAAEGLI
jgi:lambda repressor-like predicted transcriptional regulator